MHRRAVYSLFLFLCSLSFTSLVFACDSCSCTLARCGLNQEDLKKPFFFDFTVEQQRWKEQDAMALHELHHEGHHVHYKTHEEFYHFSVGSNVSEAWTFLADLPYVSKRGVQVDTHRRVGQHEVSEGLGDLKLTATYRFLRNESFFLGAIGGVKFPTGNTKELNPVGERFEQEMQPGTGSYDYICGAGFQGPLGAAQFHGNALYTIKTEGSQLFEYGNAFSSYLIVDLPVVSKANGLEVRLGADINLQIEDMDKENGVRISDSGGTTLLIGPSLTIQTSQGFSVFGNFLLPVYQNLGGVHQELNCIWNTGCKIVW